MTPHSAQHFPNGAVGRHGVWNWLHVAKCVNAIFAGAKVSATEHFVVAVKLNVVNTCAIGFSAESCVNKLRKVIGRS